MQKQFTSPTVYFLEEGRSNLSECLNTAFQAAKQQNISKVVIFTASGEGVRLALETFLSRAEFEHIRVVAVTFPCGKTFTNEAGEAFSVEISPEDTEFFTSRGVKIVRAHLPLDPISPFYRQHGVLGQDLTLVGEALSMLCGGMSLCVQAVAMACDAGAVDIAEHVIALTADTAVLAQASSTRRMLGELVIRQILCKPAVLTISRREAAERPPTQMALELPPDSKELPTSTGGTPDSPTEKDP